MTVAVSTTSHLPPAQPSAALTVAEQHLTVFAETPPFLASVLADVAGATKRVWLETYIFANDTGGTRVAEALKAKAREGLDVRVFYDAAGSLATPARFFRDMEGAGVKVRAYHTLFEALRRMRLFYFINRRNHRKLLVIDDSIAYFGGMNIVDNEEPGERKTHMPSSSGWRDVHVRLQGSQQAELVESFRRVWHDEHDTRAARRRRRLARDHSLADTLKPSTDHERICFFDSAGKRDSRAARIYTRLINQSRWHITLAMAYFVPTGAILRALLRARRRHVAIRVILPDKSDVPWAQRAATYLYRSLLKRGFRIYQRRERMLHSKAMVVDDLYSLVGSANLDPRSMHINLEFLAVIRSAKFAAVINRIAQDEIANSVRVSAAHCRHSRWQNFLQSVAWWLRWLL